MILLQTQRRQVEERFLSVFVETYPDTYIHWENTASENPTNAPWIRVAFRPADQSAMDLGAENQRLTSVVLVQCFAPLNTGSQIVEEMADFIMEMFRGVRIDKTYFRNSQLAWIGQADGWYQINVLIEAVSEEAK